MGSFQVRKFLRDSPSDSLADSEMESHRAGCDEGSGPPMAAPLDLQSKSEEGAAVIEKFIKKSKNLKRMCIREIRDASRCDQSPGHPEGERRGP